MAVQTIVHSPKNFRCEESERDGIQKEKRKQDIEASAGTADKYNLRASCECPMDYTLWNWLLLIPVAISSRWSGPSTS